MTKFFEYFNYFQIMFFLKKEHLSKLTIFFKSTIIKPNLLKG